MILGFAQVEVAFDAIYAQGVWDEDGFSLANSSLSMNLTYVKMLQTFLIDNKISSVVDIGCGDWQFSRYIDWGGIEYLGLDVVSSVVERNSRLYGSECVRFTHADALEVELPEADLVICKDVFQHLPNANVKHLLQKFSKYKHCLITDYVGPPKPYILNSDIEIGSFRPIDLTKPPFSTEGKVILTFPSIGMNKQVVYIQH